MIKYFVVASDGQKYGPADVATLNHWIGEGRLHPNTMLVEEGTDMQVQASGVPALKFVAPPAPAQSPPPAAQPPAPQPATPGVPSLGNPYDTPRPGAPQPFSSNQAGDFIAKPQAHTGAILAGWATTIAAPFAIYFISYGLILILWGFRAGSFFYQQGKTTQGVVMISLNVLWGIFWLIAKFVLVQRMAGNSGGY